MIEIYIVNCNPNFRCVGFKSVAVAEVSMQCGGGMLYRKSEIRQMHAHGPIREHLHSGIHLVRSEQICIRVMTRGFLCSNKQSRKEMQEVTVHHNTLIKSTEYVMYSPRFDSSPFFDVLLMCPYALHRKTKHSYYLQRSTRRPLTAVPLS
jgi:hypothetical protein